jgi:hypothetical protein
VTKRRETTRGIRGQVDIVIAFAFALWPDWYLCRQTVYPEDWREYYVTSIAEADEKNK